MDGLYQQKHLEKTPITVEKKQTKQPVMKNAGMAEKTRQRTVNAQVLPDIAELREADRKSVLKAGGSASDIGVVSRKMSLRRVNSYNALKKKYGPAVTIETAVLMSELKKSYSGADAGDSKPDLSAALFERRSVVASAGRYDIKNIMKVKKALKDITNDPAAMEAMSLKEKAMIRAGLDSLPEFEKAVTGLLKANGLDENGDIAGKPIDKGMYDISREAEMKYRQSFSDSLKKTLGSDELKLTGTTQKEIDKLASSGSAEIKAELMSRISRISSRAGSDAGEASGKYQGALEKLRREYEDTASSLSDRLAVIGAMKKVSAGLKGSEKDKVDARIACMEQDVDFYMLRNRNIKAGRMLKGISQGRPLPGPAMAELKEKYGV